MRKILLLGLLFFLFSCGNESSKPNTGSLIDFTQYNTLQFKASASSFGVSGTRYDLNLAQNALKKFTFSSDSGTYELTSQITLTPAAKTSLSTKLESVLFKRFSQCGNCSTTRPSVWIEITDRSPALYYFSNQGDCSCPSDGANAPTLPYTSLKTLYDEILALL